MPRGNPNAAEAGKNTRFKKGDPRAAISGKKGGESPRNKNRKTISQIVSVMLSSTLSDQQKTQLLRQYPELGDDPTIIEMMTAGQVKAAVGGSTQAFNAVIALAKEEEARKAAEEEKKRAAARKTYHLDLDNIPDSFHPVIRDIRRRRHLEYVFKGGRGSTKSSTVAMIILELMKNNKEIHTVVCRKVGNTIKDSVYSKIKWAIGKQEFEEEFDAKKSPLEITLKATGQKIYFRGADDPGKIKSISPEFGYVGILWFEEVDQFAGQEEIRNIEQSVLRGGDIAYMFESFNPPKTGNNWMNRYVLEPKGNRLVHHSTYLDVEPEWLGKPFLEEAEHLKEINPNAYEHEYMGVANGNGGNVFEYLEIREITDEEISHFDKIFQGVDWGWFPDIYAFKRLYIDEARRKIYHIAEHCGNKMKNSDTAQWIIDHGFDDYTITCDSAEPKSVNDYKDSGLPARGAVKGPGSVEYGMKFLQGYTHVIDPKRTPTTYKEYTEYEYERDKEGNVISGYPDHDNHTIDADRYALESHYNRRGNKA